MKTKKLILSLFLFINILVFGAASVPTNAAKLSPYAESITEKQTTNLLGGVSLYEQKIKTLYDGITDPKNTKYAWNSHSVQWVDMASASQDVKVVTWSEGTADAWKSSTVRKTAADFETKNPGWIVVAAVNGDFFDINGTFEPTNNFVQMGDVYRPDVLADANRGVLGFADNGTVKIGKPSVANQMGLYVTENGSTNRYIINAVNTTPSISGITLITKDIASNVNLTGYTVYEGEYTICRVSSGGCFVKGKIVKVVTDITNSKPEKGKFYLASKDGSLDEKLSVGASVKCQYDLTGDWSHITNTVGYIYQILNNSSPLHQANSISPEKNDFIYTNHPRTLVGFKADGKPVMMVVDGRGTEADARIGASLFQGGELMRLAGCTSAYNLDGGGSSTLIVRNALGGFDTINKPSDGSERSIGNAVLFVMRDPGFLVSNASSTRDSITIKRNDTASSALVQNIQVEVDGKKYLMPDQKLTITELKENTEYAVTVTYQIPDANNPSKLLNGIYKTTAKTAAFVKPPSGLSIAEITNTTIRVVKETSQTSGWIQDVVVKVGDNRYQMGNETSFVIENLYKDTTYAVVFEYIVKDPESGNDYPATDPAISIKTLSYELPNIENFELFSFANQQAIFKYKYSDNDGVVTKAYILWKDQKIELTKKLGNITVSDIDNSKADQVFEIVLEYRHEDGSTKTVKSEIIMIEKTGKSKNCSCKKDSVGFSLLSVSCLAFLLFKRRGQ